MKELIKSIFRFIGSRDFLVFLVLSFAGYIILERTGLLRLEPASYREIFHSSPSKVLSLLFAVNAFLGLVFSISDRGLKNRIGTLLFYLSIIILVTGLWLSIYTSFEGKAIRSQGQTFNAFKTDYIQQSLFIAKYADLPQVGILLNKLDVTTTMDLKSIKEVKAEVSYSGRTTGGKILEGEINSSWPLISDWTFIKITDFGYEVKYVLKDLNEEVLESHYLDMKLFPPGAENSFQAMFLGYLFYIRCYPDYVDKDGKPSSLSAYPNNPMFNLRIVRNKDIVFNDLLKPTGKVRFDNHIISLPEVRMWVEISFVRDFGLPVVAVGILLLIFGSLLMFRRTS